MKIPFNIPALSGKEKEYMEKALLDRRFSGDGAFTKKCHAMLEKITGCKKALLTTSGTHALDLAAVLADIGPGDEVIMSSFTFTSTANAFILRGGKIVFVDIRPDTMNIDERLIEAALTPRTKAIVPMHYGGVSCEMDVIMSIAEKHRLLVIEDAAQAVLCGYKGRAPGTIGDMGIFSFHETKNLHCGEGGALLINNDSFIERAEIVREKGTDRSKFIRGEIDKYTWVDIGSSYLPSELNAAFLLAQLESADAIMKDRLETWDIYYEGLYPLKEKGFIDLPFIPEGVRHNAHLFFIKLKDRAERDSMIDFLRSKNIQSVFHYIPLHSSPAGTRFGRFSGDDVYTSRESGRLLRLPLWYGMRKEETDRVIAAIGEFFA